MPDMKVTKPMIERGVTAFEDAPGLVGALVNERALVERILRRALNDEASPAASPAQIPGQTDIYEQIASS